MLTWERVNSYQYCIIIPKKFHAVLIDWRSVGRWLCSRHCALFWDDDPGILIGPLLSGATSQPLPPPPSHPGRHSSHSQSAQPQCTHDRPCLLSRIQNKSKMWEHKGQFSFPTNTPRCFCDSSPQGTHPLVLVDPFEGVLRQRLVHVAQLGHHGAEQLGKTTWTTDFNAP